MRNCFCKAKVSTVERFFWIVKKERCYFYFKDMSSNIQHKQCVLTLVPMPLLGRCRPGGSVFPVNNLFKILLGPGGGGGGGGGEFYQAGRLEHQVKLKNGGDGGGGLEHFLEKNRREGRLIRNPRVVWSKLVSLPNYLLKKKCFVKYTR